MPPATGNSTDVTLDAAPAQAGPMWAKVVDHSRCIGCHACTTACKSENEVPLSVTRTYVKYVDAGLFPEVRRSFQVTRCNQCADPPCVEACPTSAMFQRSDGIVDFDKAACIGCKACIAACPYDAIFINPADHSAEKCNFCAHRIDMGLEPACVVVCPTQALLVGDMTDPSSEVGRIVHREPVSVRRPEKETRPKLFYKEATHLTLDPLAAARPSGGIFMWSEQGELDHQVPSGHPGPWNSSAAAVLSYDIPHRAPWDYRVSLYTWTKSIAAGALLAPVLLILFGGLDPGSLVVRVTAPLLAGVFLAVTGLVLIWDLEHPGRFYLIFLRPQWRSWLVRGGFILGGYGAYLAVHFLGGLGGRPLGAGGMVVGGVLATLAAVYTAFLFGQAKARDLWQSPLLPPHLFVQAVAAGAGALMLVPTPGFQDSFTFAGAMSLFALANVVHLALILGEVAMPAGTAHARLAESEMVHGRFRRFFWIGTLAAVVGSLSPWLGLPAVVVGLGGLLAYEHAYVQAGQSVPLA